MKGHYPVMVGEMIESLAPQGGESYLDATFGGGGYTRAILEAANCNVYALDRDPDAIARSQKFIEQYPNRLTVLQGSFSELPQLCHHLGITNLDGVVFDLGVSSYQIDEPSRGFSFRFDGPLDMRMSAEGLSAADVVNTYSEEDLAEIIYRYGEERRSRQIARRIVEARRITRFTTTQQLADLVKSIVHLPGPQHPATLTFQALRIFVNNELTEVDSGLRFAENILKPGGRLVVVTFHSLEDRLVKNFLKERTGKQGTFSLIHRRGITASPAELKQNPRSRSARLRSAVRQGGGL